MAVLRQPPAARSLLLLLGCIAQMQWIDCCWPEDIKKGKLTWRTDLDRRLRCNFCDFSPFESQRVAKRYLKCCVNPISWLRLMFEAKKRVPYARYSSSDVHFSDHDEKNFISANSGNVHYSDHTRDYGYASCLSCFSEGNTVKEASVGLNVFAQCWWCAVEIRGNLFTPLHTYSKVWQ